MAHHPRSEKVFPRRRLDPRLAAAGLTVVWLLAARPAVAQIVHGQIVDSLTQAPLASAVVTLLDTAGVDLARTVADETGLFLLRADAAGRYRLRVSHEAYRVSLFPPFDLEVGQKHTLMLLVAPLPTQVSGVTVEAEGRRARRPLEDFWRRRADGFGSYVTRAEFESTGNPTRPTQVLQRMQGVRVFPNPNYQKGVPDGRGGSQLHTIDTRRWVVTMTRGGPRTFGYARRDANAGECPPLYFVDGLYVGNGRTVDVDAVVSVENIEAIEAYGTAAGLPLEFNRPGSACGVIVFWTR